MGLKWNRKVRVLVADDSLVMRGIFRELFAVGGALARVGSPEMELCGLAKDGIDCLEAVAALNPDVLLLDLEMPRMHGLEVLSRLRSQVPGLPTIMCSASTARGARMTLDGLALGAADYVTKPTMKSNPQAAMDALAADLLPKIEGLAGWAVSRTMSRMELSRPVREGGGLRATSAAVESVRVKPPVRKMAAWGAGFEQMAEIEVVAIGVSTGGPSALELMLPRLPLDFPVPVLIVQHMPKLFSTALAERLNRFCALRVQEAYDGALVLPGTIWLAPGDCHMEVRASVDGKGTMVRLLGGEAADLYKPAVDRLFVSVAKRYGAGGLGLVMTGMGSDGLMGSRAMREAGGAVLVQDEASSAVWGMPGRVVEAGLATAKLPLEALAGELVRMTMRGTSKDAGKGYETAARASYREGSNGLL